MKIALDIGHQFTGDRGAVSKDGLSENAYWTEHYPKIVNALRNYLPTAQIRVFRRDNYGNSVSKECAAINAWGADVAVSLHLNSASETATGHEVLYFPGSEKGKDLAGQINICLHNLKILKDRGRKTPFEGRGNTWLSKTSCPAVIVEAAFLSNPNDVKILRTYADDICVAIAQGISYHFA